MKQLKSFFATIALLLCCIPAGAVDFEMGGIYYNITDSEKLTVEVTYRDYEDLDYFEEYTGNVVIPESVRYSNKTYSVTRIGNSAFSYCDGLTSITIPNSVTHIGKSAFLSCTNLSSATIGNGITTIGTTVFAYCSSLTSITIPDGVTIIGSSAFYDCI